jgi:hypothetical protein
VSDHELDLGLVHEWVHQFLLGDGLVHASVWEMVHKARGLVFWLEIL